MTYRILTTAAATAVALSACSPYDPELGDTPFRCGTSEPRCPEDYVCVTHSPTRQICEREGSQAVDPPDAAVQNRLCADDTELEPNDTIGNATYLGIPDRGTSHPLGDLAICKTNREDVDFFFFRTEVAEMNARVDLHYNPGDGQLTVELLNASGTSIRTGVTVEGVSNLLRAAVDNLPNDLYYVRVSSPAGISNDYELTVVTSGP